ncbi:MAG TPA: hypothetical protein VJZ00_03010 [Thermoanaerobaculia bacterium]|nr:hypothetical protein [Thermoanaerobaculia bacterium]
MRPFAFALTLLLTLGLAAAPKKQPAPIAPSTIAHPVALFLGDLSKEGARSVTFKAVARGTHFFFEESTGVTVYRFANGSYVKETFMRGAKLAAAIKKYEK